MGDDKTKWIFEDDDVGGAARPSPITETLGSGSAGNETTREGGASDLERRATRMVPGREKTMLYHAGVAGRLDETPSFSGDVDPVVGWLVVVKGPGLGCSVPLGSGVNPVGRDPDERVALPFGDHLISNKDHVRIIYDEEERAYLIAAGSSKNVTRVNRKVVGNTEPLDNFATIQLTKATHLRFVAFCGQDFDWADLLSSEDGATG